MQEKRNTLILIALTVPILFLEMAFPNPDLYNMIGIGLLCISSLILVNGVRSNKVIEEMTTVYPGHNLEFRKQLLKERQTSIIGVSGIYLGFIFQILTFAFK